MSHVVFPPEEVPIEEVFVLAGTAQGDEDLHILLDTKPELPVQTQHRAVHVMVGTCSHNTSNHM